jgi:CHAT domain-containing protein
VILAVASAMLAWPVVAAEPASLARARCMDSWAAPARILDRTVPLAGNAAISVELPANSTANALVYAIERGVDAEVEVRDAAGTILAIADNPVARSGVQRVWIASRTRAPVTVQLRGREHAGVSGSIRLLAIAVPASRDAASCASLEKGLAAADGAYASARTASKGSTRTSISNAPAALEAASSLYEKAAASFSAAGLTADRGYAELATAALNYYDLPEWAKSAKWAEQAASTLRRAGDAYATARAQAVLAAAWLEIATKSSSSGQTTATPADSHLLLDRARTLLARLERFHAGRKEWYDRALQVNNIGLAYFNESRYEPALQFFNKALAEFEQQRETQRIAVALQNIALCEWGLGRLSAAVPRLDRALGLMSPQPYPDLYLATLYTSALANYAAGRFDESLRLNAQSLDLATSLQLDRARARAYYGMGVAYYGIGDRDLAARFLRSSLEILTADVDARGRVSALRSLAVLEHEIGDLAQASAHNSEALRLATAPSARSRIILRLAADYLGQKQTVAALGMLNPLAGPNGDKLVQALARAQRGKVYRASGDLNAARRDMEFAISTLRTYEAVVDEFDARVELARIERAAGNDDKALVALDRALILTDEITAQTVNPEYRASIAQSVRPALDLKMDLLWDRYERLLARNDTAAARALALDSLRTADNSRARAFDQLRAQRLDAKTDPKLAELQATVATLYRDISERRFQLSTREDRVGAHDAIATNLRQDIVRLRARLGVANAELAKRAAPRAGAAGRSREDGIANVLAAPRDRAFVEYWVGAENTYAWAISGGRLLWLRLAQSEQVERVARRLHDSMRTYATTPVRDRLNQSAELYRLVIAPLSAQLAGATELTLVLDGPLHYVPFSTLRDASTSDRPYLVQRFGIASLPALRFMRSESSARPAAWSESRMLLVADPVYRSDDPRLHRVARVPPNNDRLGDILRMRAGVDPSQLERLISSALESERIRSLPGLGAVDVLEGFDATRNNVLSQDFERYRFIHISSHGIIDSEIPQLSALILGAWDRDGRVKDQYVRAGDLLGRTFDAEVVVLSACDTALGREFAGEGLIGLRYAALARGARSVVGSLWPVSDAIAAEVMTDMYRYITSDGQRVELALSAAIRATLARTPALDPALWGPFAVYVARD